MSPQQRPNDRDDHGHRKPHGQDAPADRTPGTGEGVGTAQAEGNDPHLAHGPTRVRHVGEGAGADPVASPSPD